MGHKTISNPIAIITAIVLWSFCSVNTVSAQQTGPTTDVPRTLSYQGMITDGLNSVTSGLHKIVVTFYSDAIGASPIWNATYSTNVTNGVFNLLLGDVGTQPLPEPAAMNRPIWVGVSVDANKEMRPLSQLSASAYALNVPDKSTTANKLAPGAVTPDKMNADYIASISV